MRGLALVAELGSPALKRDGAVRCVRVTPDGKRIVAAGDGPLVELWKLATGECAGELATGERTIYTLAVSSDGRHVFVGGEAAQVFELVSRRRVAAPAVTKRLIVAAAFGPDGSFVFGDDRIPRRFDAAGRELAPLKGHRSSVEAVAISRDGTRALTCGGDGKIKLHVVDDKLPVVTATWDGHGKSCGFSPDGTLAWVVGYGHASIRGVTSARVTFVETELAQMRLGAMSADGTRFAIATEDAVVVYALPGKRRIARLEVAADSLAFTPDGKQLVVTNDGRGRGSQGIAVFDIAGERRILPADAGHTGAIAGLAVAAAMPHALFSIGADGVIVMWDLETATPIERIGSMAGQGRAIACTPDGQTLVATSDHGGLVAWSVARTEGKPFAVDGVSGLDVAIAPDAEHVAYLSYEPRNIQIYALATRAVVAQTTSSRAGGAGAVAFARRDLVVATAADGAATTVRLPAGTREWTELANGFINALCVAGDAVVVGTSGGRLAVLDAATGRWRAVLADSGREILRVCTVDLNHVAVLQRAADFESTELELWSLATGRSVGTVHLGVAARCLATSPDGRRIYVGTNTSRVLVFERR